MAKRVIKLMKPFHRHEHFVFVDFLKVLQSFRVAGFFGLALRSGQFMCFCIAHFLQSMLFESRKPCLNVLKPPVTVANVIKKKSIRCLGNGRENLEKNQAQLGESVLL